MPSGKPVCARPINIVQIFSPDFQMLNSNLVVYSLNSPVAVFGEVTILKYENNMFTHVLNIQPALYCRIGNAVLHNPGPVDRIILTLIFMHIGGLQLEEILNGWNRHAEALGMLSRSKELLGTSGLDQRSPRKAKTRRHAREKERSTGADEVSQILATEFNDSDPDKISWALKVARRVVLARSENAEMLLRAIITHCEIYPNENLRQHLVARGELLALYEKLDVADQRVAAFESAMNALKQTWDLVDWDEDRLEHFEIMEASLQLIANLLKSGYKNEARRFFEEAVELAAKTFGTTDERTIWILIAIGIVYQTHMGWSDARDWFEQAFAAALDEWGPDPKEGIVRSLQVALDREHFSYVSDEGRPYKTVFGVSGIRIMPGRLHLE